MFSQTFIKLLRFEQIMQTLLWFVFTALIVLVIAISYYLEALQREALSTQVAPSVLGRLSLLWLGTAIILTLASFLVYQVQLSHYRIRAVFFRHSDDYIVAIQEGVNPEEKNQRLSQLSKEEIRLFLVSRLYRLPFFTCLVCDAFIAVLGMMFVVSQGRVVAGFPFFVSAILLNIVYFPRLGAFVRKASGIVLPPLNEVSE